MKTKMAAIRIPKSADELKKILHKQFKELTGQSARRGRNIFVSRYSKGGMSSGIVCSDFWLDKGFPLIIKRYKSD